MRSSNSTGRLSDLITWFSMTNNQVVINNNGTLQKTYVFKGVDSTIMTQEDLDTYTWNINHILKRLNSGYMLFWEAQKQPDYDFEEITNTNKLLEEVEEERKLALTGRCNHAINYYLTIVYKQPNETLYKLTQLVDKDTKSILRELKATFNDVFKAFSKKGHTEEINNFATGYIDYVEQIEEDFLEYVSDFVALLRQHFLDIRPLTAAETLTYLHSTISDTWHPITSDIRTFIVQNLSDSTFLTGREPKLGKYYLGIVGIKDFPSTLHPAVFSKLNSLNSRFRLCFRYLALSKMESKATFEEIQGYHDQRSQKPSAWIARVRNQPVPTDAIDKEAVRDVEEIDEALKLVDEDAISSGHFTINCVLFNENLEVLKSEIAEVKEIINGRGFISVIDNDNTTSAWLSTIPSVYDRNVRKYLTDTLSVACCLPITAYWEGQKKNKHFESLNINSSALMKCTTTEKLPFYLNLHVEDIGHTFIAGATGTGKSVLLNTIALHYKKYPNSKVFIFDKSASSRVLTQAMGGNFYNLLVDDSIAFQPLSNITNSTERIWVNEWLLRYAESRNANLTESEKMALSNALFSLSNPSYPKEDLTITTLKLQIQDEKWRILLSNLQGVEDDGGTYGKLFDSNVDKFGEGNWQVFEMEKIMENEAIVGPTLDYLFHRIEGQLTGEPALIILDECWLFLRNKAFRKKIIEYIKDLRKKNASIIMATQNLSDIDDEMLPVITENMLTKIYLANSYINEHSRKMYSLFGLNDKEIDLVKNLHAKKQYFYKSTLGGRIFDLALSPTEFKFVSATSKRDQLKVAQLQSLPPDEFIEVWKEEGPLLPEN